MTASKNKSAVLQIKREALTNTGWAAAQWGEPFVPDRSVPLFAAWCLRNEGVSSVLLGSSNPEQLIENLGAIQASARGGAAPAQRPLRYIHIDNTALIFLTESQPVVCCFSPSCTPQLGKPRAPHCDLQASAVVASMFSTSTCCFTLCLQAHLSKWTDVNTHDAIFHTRSSVLLRKAQAYVIALALNYSLLLFTDKGIPATSFVSAAVECIWSSEQWFLWLSHRAKSFLWGRKVSNKCLSMSHMHEERETTEETLFVQM